MVYKKKKSAKWIKPLLAILAIIAGINWVLVGIWDFDIVSSLFGAWPMIAMIVYVLAGGAAAWIGFKTIAK